MHRLTEIAANGDVEVQPRYQAAALRRLAAYEDMHQDLEGQLENVNEKLADIEENGSTDPQAQQLFAQQIAIKATLAMYEAYGISEVVRSLTFRRGGADHTGLPFAIARYAPA